MTNQSEHEPYAVIQTGGKQYRVKAGDVIDVELLGQENGTIEFNEVLFGMHGGKSLVDAPSLAKAVVRGEVVGEVRGPKVISYKFKKRKNTRRKIGHRQDYTRVRITEIAV